MMKVALDVQYGTECAAAAAVCFGEWDAGRPATEHAALERGILGYEPGHFVRRELPPLKAVLGCLETSPSLLIVDGYVWLGPDRPGLGWHLHAALGGQVPVIGVAKNPFAGNSAAVELRRGASRRPLFITALGIDLAAAVEGVRSMHGENRVPTLLQRVDRLARDRLREAGPC